MIKNILIKNFKSIVNQSFDLPPLTILTGLNSTGKSSVIQSILLLSKYYSRPAKDSLNRYVSNFLEFRAVRNKYQNAKEITIETTSNEDFKYSLVMNDNGNEAKEAIDNQGDLTYEDKIYYISSNRIGQEEFSTLTKDEKIGLNGEYIVGYFENNKNKSLIKDLVKFDGSTTLGYQLNGWLKEILGIEVEFKTEKIASNKAKISFDIDGLDGISPFNVGAGNSYVAKIIITCLMCDIGDVVLIENPEIHLHPKAQSKLGEFFSWIAQSGIQIILETHSEHLINKIRHQVYSEKIGCDNVIIYYKKSIQKDFIPIKINKSGHYEDSHSNRMRFPSGFFDSTLKELLTIG